MENETAALPGDTLADLKSGLERRSGSRYFMAGSNSSWSSNETRTSRFNDRPVVGSPILAAREYLSASSDGTPDSSLRDFLSLSEKAAAAMTAHGSLHSLDSLQSNDHNHHNKSPHKIKHFQQKAKHKLETTKEIFDRRINRIGASFFRENPSEKVPRFVPNELSLGDRLGEGEFGSVYEIDSLRRQPLPCLDFNSIDKAEKRRSHISEGSSENSIIKADFHRIQSDDSAISARGAPIGATLTLPLSTDLMVGSPNLDNFLKRRVEGFEEQPVGKENSGKHDPFQNTNNDHFFHSMEPINQPLKNSLNSKESLELHDLHPPRRRRRAALKVSDRKGQMINRQNNADDIDSFDGYVVKVVRDDIQTERKKRVAAADMAAEAKLLSALSHPNIIRVRGIMGYIERPGNYGIIMDKLRSTLQDQIHEWAKITAEDDIPKAAPEKHTLLENKPEWMLKNKDKEKKKKLFRQTKFFVERMEAVLDVSDALKYLHEKRIIFRDLKPENVGMTNDNYVLFDFGLSRELKESDKVGEDQYRATSLTGSRLFMAPEVATHKPYGFSADVYSFGIMFWEVVSLKEVFPTMTMSKHYKLVIQKGKRPPSLEDILPPELNEMMEAAWDKNPSNRPTFESISETLNQELEKYDNEKGNSTNSGSSSFLNFSWLTDGENDENNKSSRRGLKQKSLRALTKQLHLDQLEKVTEKILRISPKSSRSTSPNTSPKSTGRKYNAGS